MLFEYICRCAKIKKLFLIYALLIVIPLQGCDGSRQRHDPSYLIIDHRFDSVTDRGLDRWKACESQYGLIKQEGIPVVIQVSPSTGIVGKPVQGWVIVPYGPTMSDAPIGLNFGFSNGAGVTGSPPAIVMVLQGNTISETFEFTPTSAGSVMIMATYGSQAGLRAMQIRDP